MDGGVDDGLAFRVGLWNQLPTGQNPSGNPSTQTVSTTSGPSSEPTHIRARLDGGKFINKTRTTYGKCEEQTLNQRAFDLADRARLHTFDEEYLLHAHGESVMNSSVRSSFPFDSHSSFTSAAAVAEAAACARFVLLRRRRRRRCNDSSGCSRRHGRTRENKSDKRTARRHG